MENQLPRIILSNLLRNALTVVITFFATKHVIQADVAAKLNRGDTVSLYGQDIPINLTMIINVLVALALPILIPIGIGIWGRMKTQYTIIVARAERFAMTPEQLKEKTAQASPIEIIKTVAANQPTT